MHLWIATRGNPTPSILLEASTSILWQTTQKICINKYKHFALKKSDKKNYPYIIKECGHAIYVFPTPGHNEKREEGELR
jgi:hypothetical protein